MTQEDNSVQPSAFLPVPVRRLVASVATTWNERNESQQRRLLTIFILAALVVGGLAWWAVRPNWKTLYSGLTTEDAKQVSALLTAAGIEYDISADGGLLKVPSSLLNKARLTTAAKVNGKSGRIGFSLFDKPNWAGSEFDEKVNYQRALEGELEQTIESLTAIQTARVHIVFAHDTLFQDQQRDAKASVVLRLRGGTLLSEGEMESIRSLVASAVDDLKPEHVVLVDSQGHSPLVSPTGLDKEEMFEDQLASHIVQTLEPITGDGNVMAKVTAEFDTSSYEETEERYDPSSVVNLSMQRSEEVAGSRPASTGVPGTASNAPNQQPPLFPANQPDSQSTKQETGTYAASKKVSHKLETPGRLRRITAAVIVNDHLVPGTKKNTAPTDHPWTSDELKQLTALVQAAIGYEGSRGDQVVVQNLHFQSPAAASRTSLQTFIDGAIQNDVLLKYATVLLLLVAFGLLVLKPTFKHLASAALPVLRQVALPGGVQDTSDLSVMQPPKGSQVLFESVVEHVHRDPAQSARILQSWMKNG